MSFDHIIEVALLILAAYLIGCIAGYSARRFAHANSQDRYMPAVLPETALHRPLAAPDVPAPTPPKAAQSAARRLARAAANDDLSSDRTPSRAEIATPDTSSQSGLARPPEQPAPRDENPDDLKQIKGIGQKSESALHALGIFHFDQIAAWTPANIAWLESRIALKGRIGREQWVEQASLLATQNKPHYRS